MNSERVVVTGSSSGIGLALVKQLLSSNYTVIGVDRALPEVRSKSYQHIVGEVSREETWVSVLECIDKLRLGGIVHLAGQIHREDGAICSLTKEVFETTMQDNLLGALLGTKILVKELRKSQSQIVFVSSLVAKVGSHRPQLAYTAAKGALLSVTREIAVSEAQFGVRCNCIVPGLIDTPMLKGVGGNDTSQMASRIPLQRIGAPEEVAELIKFLLESSQQYINGAVLTVDGGLTIENPTTLLCR